MRILNVPRFQPGDSVRWIGYPEVYTIDSVRYDKHYSDFRVKVLYTNNGRTTEYGFYSQSHFKKAEL